MMILCTMMKFSHDRKSPMASYRGQPLQIDSAIERVKHEILFL